VRQDLVAEEDRPHQVQAVGGIDDLDLGARRQLGEPGSYLFGVVQRARPARMIRVGTEITLRRTPSSCGKAGVRRASCA
jgi:hypothetical protein